MNPKVYNRFKSLFDFFGCIPAPSLEDKCKNNFVKRIYDELKDVRPLKLLISPKGTVLNSPWKSGYYYIAKELNADVVVYGLDYEKKKLVYCGSHEINKDVNEFNQDMKDKFSEIVALYPERECGSTAYNANELCFIDPLVLSMNVSSVIALICLFKFDKLSFFFGLVTSIISHNYHINKERKYRKLDFVSAIISIYVFFSALNRKTGIPHDYTSMTICGLSLLAYFIGSGREYDKVRTRKYIISHSLFHMLSCLYIVKTTILS
jgi:hypothetical protein